jgi:inorganic pyrophosphatase
MAVHGFPRRLEPFADEGQGSVHVVIEAPAGSRNKYKYEPKVGAFLLDNVLPAGAVFPHDYGFVPGTKGEDGDPIDAMVLLDAPSFSGCALVARPIGVIHARQVEKDGRTVENDRILAVGTSSRDHEHTTSIRDIPDEVLDQIEHFFVSYHALDDTRFEPLGRADADQAVKAIRRAATR